MHSDFACLNLLYTENKQDESLDLHHSHVKSSSSQFSASEHYSAVFTATIDQTVDDPAIFMDDPELTFFKTELKFRDSYIQHTIGALTIRSIWSCLTSK